MLFDAICHPLVGQQTTSICVKFKSMYSTSFPFVSKLSLVKQNFFRVHLFRDMWHAQIYDYAVIKAQEHTRTFNHVCFCSPVYAVKNGAIIKPRKLI